MTWQTFETEVLKQFQPEYNPDSLVAIWDEEHESGVQENMRMRVLECKKKEQLMVWSAKNQHLGGKQIQKNVQFSRKDKHRSFTQKRWR